MEWAQLYQDNHIGTIVGETPGNSPTSYGGCCHDVQTPNSRITFHTTFKKFYRADQEADQNKLIPDIQVDEKNAIDKIYEILRRK